MEDRHHILFSRKVWQSSELSGGLRSTPSLVPKIDRELHNEIHRQVPLVPMLGYHALARTVRMFYPSGETLQDISRLQIAMEDAVDHPKATRTEKKLAELACYELSVQSYMLKDELNTRWIG